MVSNPQAGVPARNSPKVTDSPPTKAELARLADTTVYDADGQALPFSSLYLDPANPARHTMVIFVRHFLCGVRICRSLPRPVPPADPFATRIAKNSSAPCTPPCRPPPSLRPRASSSSAAATRR